MHVKLPSRSRNVPAVNGDRSVLSELLLGFMNLTDELNERLPAARQTVIRPVSELKLTHRA